jgi:hypothetical protein
MTEPRHRRAPSPFRPPPLVLVAYIAAQVGNDTAFRYAVAMTACLALGWCALALLATRITNERRWRAW